MIAVGVDTHKNCHMAVALEVGEGSRFPDTAQHAEACSPFSSRPVYALRAPSSRFHRVAQLLGQ